MEESVIGVWIAHGEGKFTFKEGVLDKMAAQKCVALRYVDDDGTPTEKYPMNPNGSKGKSYCRSTPSISKNKY